MPTAASFNLGSTRGFGSSSRMYYWCREHTKAPSLCINQFITQQSPVEPVNPPDETNVWRSRGRTITNDNYTINSSINSSNINNLQLIKTLPVPLCDAWSMPSADENYYYFSTSGSYLNPVYDASGQLISPINGPGNVLKISRITLEIVQQVAFSSITGFINDCCRATPVLYGNYVYLGSSKIGKNGSIVCVDKNDLTRVIWSTQLTPGSSFGFTGANAIVVDLRTLPDPSTILRSQLPRQDDDNILYQRQRMIKEHPVIVYIGTSSLEELNIPTAIDRPLQNGNLVCLDAFTGEIIWKTSMLPQQYIGGDLLDIDSLRYSDTTGLLVAYADCRVPAITGQQLITYTPGVQKQENQIRLYNNSQTTLFFQLDASGSLLPTYVTDKTILITRTDGTQVDISFNLAYGSYVQQEDAFATGQIFDYDLSGNSTIPSNINGCFILEPLYPRDIMSMAEASSMNYTGCAVWGNPVVFDTTRWQICISTGNNYTIPFDETNWVQGGQTNQLDAQMTILGNKYLIDKSNGQPQSVLDADLLAIQNLYEEQSYLLKFISNRGQKNIFNAICSIEAATGTISWAFKTKIYDVWTVGQLFIANESIITGTPWGEDADFGMGSHIYRDPLGNPNNDLYVNISKGGVIASVYANSGQVKYTSIVGAYSALGAANYGSATDGRYFYAVILNGNSLIPTFSVTLNGDPLTTEVFPYLQSYVIKYDPFSGNILWATAIGNVGDYTTSQPLVSNNILYVPDLNDYMHTFNIADGSIITNPFGDLPFSGFFSPLILKDTLFLTGGYHGIQGFFPPGYYFKPCSSIQIYKLP